jgi:hypothetical protein
MAKNIEKKYKLITTGGDVLFIGKVNSRNFIERHHGFHGDFAECMTAVAIADLPISHKQTDLDFVNQNFDALLSKAEFIDNKEKIMTKTNKEKFYAIFSNTYKKQVQHDLTTEDSISFAESVCRAVLALRAEDLSMNSEPLATVCKHLGIEPSYTALQKFLKEE